MCTYHIVNETKYRSINELNFNVKILEIIDLGSFCVSNQQHFEKFPVPTKVTHSEDLHNLFFQMFID